MTTQIEDQPSGDLAGCSPDDALYLLRSGGTTAVRCPTRWMDDHHAYVVAPLATATAMHQRWEALTRPPGQKGARAEGRCLQVELISADTLLGPDSGKEGLLLRYFEQKPGMA